MISQNYECEGQMSLFDLSSELQTQAKKVEHVPDKILKPALGKIQCDRYSKCMCNRYGYEKDIDELKSDLIKGFACAGCCWYCSAAPQHSGNCKHECRVKM